MPGFKVGIDSHCLQPLGLSHFEVLEWAVRNGAQGVQFSAGWPEDKGDPDPGLLDDLAAQARDMRLYLEWGGGQHIPLDLATNAPKDIFDGNRRAAEQARRLGTSTIRSYSGGLMRWKEENPPTETYLKETARALRDQLPMLRDNGVALALETHFEFTTFELLRLFDMCGAAPGDCLGICLDTMNLLTMLEDPLSAASRVRDWVVTTHVKDGGLMHYDINMLSFTAPAGRGVVDLAGIFRLLGETGRPINLTVEDHGGSFLLPVSNRSFLKKFPDMPLEEWDRILKLVAGTEKRLKAGEIEILNDENWPEVCEDRVREDIRAVKEMVLQTRFEA
ncbi:MAG: sugar phosphate isomerase/epimerase [Candidatus Aminicenantes bacterium]|nr:sugar phosphate isomerase/epimerase [Candidatus Aminicenantes bacterium]